MIIAQLLGYRRLRQFGKLRNRSPNPQIEEVINPAPAETSHTQSPITVVTLSEADLQAVAVPCARHEGIGSSAQQGGTPVRVFIPGNIRLEFEHHSPAMLITQIATLMSQGGAK